MTEHERVAESLGAWALGACSDVEARAIEEHLNSCVACAAEEKRLRQAADWIGTGEPLTPPPRLREATLATAFARRPPRAAPLGGLAELTRAYALQVAGLDALLGELTGPQWEITVPRHHTVRGLLAHLAANDAMVVTDLGLAPAKVPTASPADLRRSWRDQATGLLRTVSAADVEVLDRPARLAGARPTVRPLRDALIQRTFETWTHADDVRAVLHRPAGPPPAQVQFIVSLGVRLLPVALRALGRHHPNRTARLALTGQGGGGWLVPLAPDTPAGAADVTIIADAVEFCRLMANRRTPNTLRHTVEGDQALAADVLRVASTLGCD